MYICIINNELIFQKTIVLQLLPTLSAYQDFWWLVTKKLFSQDIKTGIFFQIKFLLHSYY